MQHVFRTMPGKRWWSNLFGLLIVASLLLSAAATPSPVRAQAEPPAASPERVNYHQLIVKMVAGAGAQAVQPAAELPDLNLQPMFTTLPGGEGVAAQAASPLARYFQADLGPDVTFEQAQAVLDALLQNPQVETAYMPPLLAPASNLLATPDSYVAQQGYLAQMNVALSGGPTGSKGANVTLLDIEGGWQIGHEDLPIGPDSLLEGSANASDLEWINHGTAVLGIIAGRDNSYGITGIAPDTYIRMLSALGYTSISQAIVAATAVLRPGDIILLPVMALGPRTAMTCPDSCDCSAFEYIPVEYWQDTFDAITAATSAGIIVVEAAGTGAVNLDNNIYTDRFNRSKRDSGAILVGAGASDTHAPVCNANTGSRIDLQGWGNNVVTTGYGDLYQDGDANPSSFYTSTFGGSSAAAAMVAGAISSLQGVAKARGYLLTAAQARDFLVSTGTPQGGNPATEHIGPLPNIAEAIKKISDGVELVSPADNENLYTLRPYFDWQPYLGATQYQLIVSSNSTFSPLELNITTSSTEYIPTTNLRVGQHYWKVRPALNGVWQNWSSSYRTFNIVSGTIETPKVTLSKPSDGYLTSDTTPTLSWKAVSGITGYELLLSKDPAFVGVAPIVIAGAATNSYTPAAALDWNSRYYWRVRTYVTTGGNTYQGPWSLRRVFYTTINIAGINPSIAVDQYEDTLQPTFTWNAVPNARGYRLQIVKTNTSKAWASPYLSTTIKAPSSGGDPATSWRPGKDLPRSTTLYFRVQALGNYGYSASSPVAMFVTSNPPSAPTVKAPADKAIVNDYETGVVFSWLRPTSWKTNPAVTYNLQISTTSKFTSGLIELNIDNSGASIQTTDPVGGLAPETAYYWRMRAVGALGTGNWTAIRRFYTTPPIPTGLSALADTLRPTLDWERVELARSYQVQVAKAIDGVDNPAKIFKGSNVLTTETFRSSPPVMLSKTLPRATDLLFRVRSVGIYGSSAWSEPEAFTTPSSPNVPNLVSPSDGANINTFAPRIDWSNSSRISKHPETDAVGYQLQVVKDAAEFRKATPDTVVDEETVLSEFTLGIETLPTAGRYFWRVRAFNADGEYSIWSSVRSFTTPAMVSGTVMDALEATEMEGVSLEISGRNLSVRSNADGEYSMRGLLPGTYTLTASLNGFIRQQVSFSVGYGTNLTRNFNLASFPDDGQFRIVLNWNGTPADLDAHLWLPPTNPAHLSKDNPGDIGDDGVRAQVDVTNANNFGPEVITLDSALFAGTYTYAVYLNAAPETFVNTGARVAVYEGSLFRGEYVIPGTGIGHWWKVFTLDGTTRKISTSGADFITDGYPASYR